MTNLLVGLLIIVAVAAAWLGADWLDAREARRQRERSDDAFYEDVDATLLLFVNPDVPDQVGARRGKRKGGA